MFTEGLISLAMSFQLLVFFSDDELKIDTVTVSAELQSRGYTSDVVGERLFDALRVIVLDSGGTHATVPSGLVNTSPIEELATALNLDRTIYQLRILLGSVRHELSLELMQSGDQLRVRADLLKLPAGPTTQLTYSEAGSDIHRVLADVSKWVMRKVDPLTLMEYEFRQAKKSGDYALVYAELETCRRFYPASMRPLIDNLEGMLFLKEDKAADAATAAGFFQRALLRDPELDEARLNLALALAGSGDPTTASLLLGQMARDKNRGLHRTYMPVRAAALALQGFIAASTGATGQAMVSFRDALRADPDMAEVHALLVPVLQAHGMTTLALYHERRMESLRRQMPPKLPLAFLDVMALRRLLPLPVGSARIETPLALPGEAG